MAASHEKTYDNNIKTPTTEEKEKYYEGLKACKFIDLPHKLTPRRLTAAEIAAIDGVLNRRIRKKKRRLVSARKQKNKVATSEKTDDNNNNNINTPSTEEMGRRFDTMPIEEKMKYNGCLQGCTSIDASIKRRLGPFTAAEIAAIEGILYGGIRKKKKRLVSARKQKNKVATFKKTDDNNNINNPSPRFDTMPLEEKAVEKAAIEGVPNGGIRKKKRRLVSARKQKNKVATSKKTNKV